MSDPTHRLRIGDLPTRRPTAFALAPDAEAAAALARDLGLLGLRKLAFAGEIAPLGRRDWRLTARLGATVVQPCVVTLAPVTTRLDETVERTFLADWQEPEPGAETEMPEDDRTDPLPEVLDLDAVMAEALALALPLYPRADGASLGEAVYTAPGAVPLTDAEAKPLAGLKALKDRLGRGGGGSGGSDT